jgi:hypothetical protein
MYRRVPVDARRLQILIQSREIVRWNQLQFLVVVVAIRLRTKDSRTDARLSHEEQRRNDLEEPSFDPVGHVMRVRMTPMNVQRDDSDEDRRIDQNQGEKKIRAEKRHLDRCRRNQIDQKKIEHLQSNEDRDRQGQLLATIT